MLRLCSLIVFMLAARSAAPQAATVGSPPPSLVGEFRDDYGNQFHVSDSLFVQLPRLRYHVVEWNLEERYLLARNAEDNPSDRGLWTRIDWMAFTDMAPYTWGFCLTAYRAATAAAARATPPPDRTMPRTGCNGFPFSRMRRAE